MQPNLTVSSQRGRRLHLPEDDSSMSSTRMHVDGRVAWLLTTSRILGPDAELARRAVLISRMGERGIALDAPRLSRLEAGAAVAGTDVIVGYEQVLGLTSGQLSATITGIRRTAGGQSAPRERKTVDPRSEADLDRLLNLVADNAATGADWLQVSGILTRFERVFLRQDDWTNLCDTLIRELATSSGLDYVRRFEAATALLQHPSARRHLSRAIGNFIVDPDVQVTSPVLNLIAEVSDPAASELVLRLLGSSVESLRRAASSVAASKVARGHFDAAALSVLEKHVESQLARGVNLDGGLDSLDLATHLPRASWQAVESRLRDPLATALVVRARSTRELISSRRATALSADVATVIQDATPTHRPLNADLMLHRLVREALVHVHKERRHQAALLIAASPYAPAAADHFSHLTRHHDDFIAARAWTVLMRLPNPTPTAAPPMNLCDAGETHLVRALLNAGLHDRSLPAHDQTQINALLPSRRPQRQHGVCLALGMHASPVLASLTEHEDVAVRRAAGWWLRQGGATRDDDSAAQRGSRAN